MKTLTIGLWISIAVCVLTVALLHPRAPAADGRVITEGTTNILAIGIDSRDFDTIRFYLRGSNTLELRAEDLLHKARLVLPPPPSPAQVAERDALVSRMSSFTNDITALNAPTILSNLVRLRQLEDRLR